MVKRIVKMCHVERTANDDHYLESLPAIEKQKAIEHVEKRVKEFNQKRLDPDFVSFIRILNSVGIEYLIIGGYAVAHYGHTRMIGDLDIWINPNRVNRFAKALKEFGVTVAEEFIKEALNIDNVVQIGLPPHRIDVLCVVGGLEFDQCYAQKVQEKFKDFNLTFIDLPDLIKMKRIAGRVKDLRDINSLEGSM